ncbi:MAG: dimethyl sulfoxide reductase anchor subunit [Planctomycetia bacterium]|nr:dimethyl sulfoxide reductase anchor subunit [Planctomycetia bacterium]
MTATGALAAEPRAAGDDTAIEPVLVERSLAQQQTLTAVEQFAALHDSPLRPANASRYAALLPARSPADGEQYAFEVDLDRCSGCKSCVTACHSLNGLAPGETWRDVGLLHGGTDELPVLQHVTAACHHCLEPACLSACPVKAYEKDPRTGIVKHLDDQCIGCQYCIFACPYDVPKYNRQLGIVRKCDMCSTRLAAGEPPACVQACPTAAIRITLVRRQEIIEGCETGVFLPGAPDSGLTLPTTHYKTRRAFPRNLLPADYHSIKPERAHWPLVLMLVLTQLAVGAFAVGFVLDRFAGNPLAVDAARVHAVSSLAFGALALAVSVLHLGRPLYAFRAVLGLRTSWLSREILAFSLFAPLAAAYAAALWLAPTQTASGTTVHDVLGATVVASGLCGVIFSIKVYQCTGRSFWNGVSTSLKFLLTTLLLGIATVLLTSAVTSASSPPSLPHAQTPHDFILLYGLIAASAVKLLTELAFFLHLGDRRNNPAKRSALLMAGPLRSITRSRFALGVVGGLWAPAYLLLSGPSAAAGDAGYRVVAAAVAFVALVLGELLERYLFFAAVVPPKMPGRFAA